MHGIAGSGEGVVLGNGAMVLEIFFAAAGKGGVICRAGGTDELLQAG